MNIVLIGAGNVATSMAVALQKSGQNVLMVYSRTLESASVLASQLGVPYTNSLDNIPDDADVYISMLADDALIKLAPHIVADRKNVLFLHTAGSVSIDVWKNAGAQKYGVLYPMQTFSKNKQVVWQHIPLFIEAVDGVAMEQIEQLAYSLSDNVTRLDSIGRKRLHLAAVFACNFANRMFAISESILNTDGIPFSVMLPLIKEMTDKACGMSPAKAQTGPAVRNDRTVMDSHIELLGNNPEWAELYKLISEDIIKDRRL